VRSCHDLSEGGLAVAAAEMAFAGGLGLSIELADLPHEVDSSTAATATLLFSESNTRFLCEVRPDNSAAFEEALDVPHARVGEVIAVDRMQVFHQSLSRDRPVIEASVGELKESWQSPLRWK
jgi:phosphoribosylformylglycinamidine synthase